MYYKHFPRGSVRHSSVGLLISPGAAGSIINEPQVGLMELIAVKGLNRVSWVVSDKSSGEKQGVKSQSMRGDLYCSEGSVSPKKQSRSCFISCIFFFISNMFCFNRPWFPNPLISL